MGSDRKPAAIISIVIISLALLCVHAQDCGEFCAGKLPGYLGPLDTAAQIRDALEKSSFKQEVIVFAETRMEPASQFIARYLRAGYKHVLAVMGTPADCQHLHRLFAPTAAHHGNISCGYYRTHDDQGQAYSSEFEYLAHPVGLAVWWRKMFTVARSVALGYNVMAVDQDTVPLGDWYGIVKQPPMSSYTMISQGECQSCINGGFSYIQNANPAGPVAWLLYEALHRAVRWAEDPSALRAISRKMLGETDKFYMEDQSLLTDSMHSCVAGRPMFTLLLRYLGKDNPDWVKLVGHQASLRASYERVLWKFWDQVLSAEGPVADAVHNVRQQEGSATFELTHPPRQREGGAANFSMRTALLYMPHTDGEWPPLLGGNPYARGIGPLTRAYRQAFMDLGVPLPPDPEDPAHWQRANATKPELLALAGTLGPAEAWFGDWLESKWYNSGRQGLWHTHLEPKFKTVMGHVHAALMPSFDAKTLTLKLSGNYVWEAAARLYGGPERVFYATMLDDQARSTLAQIVAYAPGVIHYQLSKEQYLRAVEQLARVAVALGAVAAWPAVDCSSDWAMMPEYRNLSRPVRHSIPWIYLNTSYAVQPFGDSLETLQCEWTGFMHAGCLNDSNSRARGLLAVEVHHLLNRQLRHEPKDARRPNRANTVQLEREPSSPPAAFNSVPQRVSYDTLLSVNAELALQGRRLAYGNTLWLDRLVEVEGLRGNAAAEYDTWAGRCPALRYNQLPAADKRQWRRLRSSSRDNRTAQAKSWEETLLLETSSALRCGARAAR